MPVMVLDCATTFESLTRTERLYAHHLSQASWIGGIIVVLQTSPESPLIFLMLMTLFRTQKIPSLKKLAFDQCGINESEFHSLLLYTSQILTNLGNYDESGDKFIPNIPKDKLKSLIEKSDAFTANSDLMMFLWNECENQMFLLDNKVIRLGFGGSGVTTYFSSNCTEIDFSIINQFLQSKNIEADNTRAFKARNRPFYEIRLASELSDEDEEEKTLIGTYKYQGRTFKVTRGDYAPLLGLVNRNLEEAKKYAASENEVNMLEKYIRSFRTGSPNAQAKGTVYWLKNLSPVIETYMGFGMTYRDPTRQRGEFGIFVGMVNKEVSAKFRKLLENADSLLPLLPWPKTFEKDQFLNVDFTSLDILAYAASFHIPGGMNASVDDKSSPNVGTKNFYFGNVGALLGSTQTSNQFLSVDDQKLLDKYGKDSIEMHVGLHELFGHGTGKLFRRNAQGEFNFDVNNVTNPITGDKIKTWYKVGETYNSIFDTIKLPYEECRAESVSLLLSLSEDVLEIFGFKGSEGEDISYICWLEILLTGLYGLNQYEPDGQIWEEVYAQATFVILRVLVEAGEKFVTINEMEDEIGQPHVQLKLDRKKLTSVGKPIISSFLQKLQVYISTADITSATSMFRKYSTLSNAGVPFLKYREIIIAQLRNSSAFFVLPNTCITNNEVTLKSYEASHEGLIQSWIERYPQSLDLVSIVKTLWEKDASKFTMTQKKISQ